MDGSLALPQGQRKATKRMLHPGARPFARAPLWSYGTFAGLFALNGCKCRKYHRRPWKLLTPMSALTFDTARR